MIQTACSVNLFTCGGEGEESPLTSVVKVGTSTGDLMCVPGGEDRLVSDPMGLHDG